VPPQLSEMLSALGVSASPSEFAAVEGLLGGSFSRLSEIRRDPVAQVDAAGMAPQEVRDWLLGLPVGREAVLRVAWVADGLGASMNFGTFTANVDGSLVPGNGPYCLRSALRQFMVLVLDHEELITLSSVNPSPNAS
jgi:hypothetical protein